MKLTEKYGLEHIGRAQSRWKDVFDTIDTNFDKIDEFLCDIATRIHVTHIIADGEQRDFTLDDVYMTDTNSLAIYKNGVRQFVDTDYIETDLNSFRMNEPCDAGDKIDAVYNEFYLPEDTSSMEVQIFNSLNSLKQSIYGEKFDTLDEAIQASIDRAKSSITDLDDELIAEIQEKSSQLKPIQDRVDGILNKLMTGKFFDGVNIIWFEPHMSEDGTVSWTNNGGLENPDPVRLRFDISVPEGTVAIGAADGGYTHTNQGEYGAFYRDLPITGRDNPIPHFGFVPLDFGGLGAETTEELEKLEGYKGPLQYDYYKRKFFPIEGEGVLIRDEEGVRFGVVPVKYGGTGTAGEASPETANSLSIPTTYSILSSSNSMDYMSWEEIGRYSRLAAENPSRYRDWIGRTKKITLKEKSELPELSGYDLDFGAELEASIVGISSDLTSTGVRSGFSFSLTPILGVYSDNDSPVDNNLTDSKVLPETRKELLDCYYKLLPDDLQSLIRDTRKDDLNPITGDIEISYSKLFIPSLSEINLYDDVVERYSTEYDISKETLGCYEYYVIPKDLFFKKTDRSGKTDRLDSGEQYMLRSTALPKTKLMKSKGNLREIIYQCKDILSGGFYEPSELLLLDKLISDSEKLLFNSNASIEELERRSSDITYFVSSMIPRLDDISWDDFFDLVYELSVMSPTIMDRTDSQLDRLIGLTKVTDPYDEKKVALRVAQVRRGSNDMITLVPEQGIAFNSILRYEDNDIGGYGLNLALFNRFDDFRENKLGELNRYLVDTEIQYKTPEGYRTWINASISIPSVDEISFYLPERKLKFDGNPSEYWTRDLSDDS